MKLINSNSTDKVVCYLVSNQVAPIIILTYNILKAGPSGRSPAEIVGSNPTGGMDVCLL
jgi:hypothetical protein